MAEHFYRDLGVLLSLISMQYAMAGPICQWDPERNQQMYVQEVFDQKFDDIEQRNARILDVLVTINILQVCEFIARFCYTDINEWKVVNKNDMMAPPIIPQKNIKEGNSYFLEIPVTRIENIRNSVTRNFVSENLNVILSSNSASVNLDNSVLNHSLIFKYLLKGLLVQKCTYSKSRNDDIVFYFATFRESYDKVFVFDKLSWEHSEAVQIFRVLYKYRSQRTSGEISGEFSGRSSRRT